MKNTIRLISKVKDTRQLLYIDFIHNKEVLQSHIDAGFVIPRVIKTSFILIINEDIDKTIDNGTKPALKLVG